ncbi:hypothetical protein ACQKOH_17815 [Sphingomonas sp. NPDC092331]|jgi:hypothetical protein|uniref:hypothetical protein n=1 Tax=unclassified Sphingomonas TaxID=196159 RepID=UPI0031F53FD1
MKVRIDLLIWAILLVGACSDSGNYVDHEKDKVNNDFEHRINMPHGAKDISQYDRYYYIFGDIIVGEFIRNPNGKGRSIFLNNEAELPHIMDGGCGVINFRANLRKVESATISCNGDA